MALNVLAETEIDRPVSEVAAYAFEPTNDPKWIGGITNADLLTPRPVGLGTQVQRLAKFMGKTIDYILEVVEYVPAHLMVMKSIKSPFPMRVTYQFDSLGAEKTKASVRVEGNAKGFYSISDFLMAPMIRRNLRRDLRNLKAIVEAR
jgi:hypothetical protein